MSGTLLPVPIQFFVDADGIPYSEGSLTFEEPGTDTPAVVYADIDLSTELDNPLELNTAGRAPAIYTGAYSVDVTLKDNDGVVVWGPITVPSSSLAGANIGQGPPLFGDVSSPITANAYPPGTTYDDLHVGSVIIPLDSANLDGTYALSGMMKSPGGDTVSAILVNLSDGSPSTALATISSNSTTGERQTSGTITFPAGGATKQYGVKVKVTAGAGMVWGLELVRTE